MTKRQSVAQVRDRFAQLVHEVEQGHTIEIARRGRPVAVLVSAVEYRRFKEGTPSLREAYEAFRQKHGTRHGVLGRGGLRGVRARSTGRKVAL